MLGRQCGLSVLASLLPNKTKKYSQLCTCVCQSGSDAEDNYKTKLVPSCELCFLQAVTQSLPPAVMQAPTWMISRLTDSSLMADLLAPAHWLSTDSGPLCIVVVAAADVVVVVLWLL